MKGVTINKSKCEIPANGIEQSAAIKPKIVIGPTTGTASRFAGIEMSESIPDMAMITGVQTIVAENGMASNSASRSFQPREISRSEILGATKRIPAVAATDRAKPGSIA